LLFEISDLKFEILSRLTAMSFTPSHLTEGEDVVAYQRMKQKILTLLIACVLVGVITGCVGTVDGHSKAGVPFTSDTIRSRYERTYAQVLSAARTVLAHNGVPVSDDSIKHTLAAKINNRTVWVKIDEVEPRLTQVTVQARSKGGRADIQLASEIDKQIALQLAVSP